ncbi:hypothetical protein BDV98DRAFT_576570 [Pterulicium gracile]|uniref:Uncharacterized protein n=1 Tax=Pterulicium gracile TaxID=1884261 RepID=A0A5C3Q277_9AGAR|nr:hypothetical protein BDV98DRAFT_576570 [Pterula gracilis]
MRSGKSASLRSARNLPTSNLGPGSSLAPLQIPLDSNSDRLALTSTAVNRESNTMTMARYPPSSNGGRNKHIALSKSRSHAALRSPSSSYKHRGEYPVPALPGDGETTFDTRQLTKGVELTTVTAPNGSIDGHFLVGTPGLKATLIHGSAAEAAAMKGKAMPVSEPGSGKTENIKEKKKGGFLRLLPAKKK